MQVGTRLFDRGDDAIPYGRVVNQNGYLAIQWRKTPIGVVEGTTRLDAFSDEINNGGIIVMEIKHYLKLCQ